MMNSDLLTKDIDYIWHPYTQMKDIQTNPTILIEKAQGLKLFEPDVTFLYYFKLVVQYSRSQSSNDSKSHY